MGRSNVDYGRWSNNKSRGKVANCKVCRRRLEGRVAYGQAKCRNCTDTSTDVRYYSSPTFVCASAYCDKCQKTKMKDQFDYNRDGVPKKWCRECVNAHKVASAPKPIDLGNVGGIEIATCAGDTYQERNVNLATIGFSSYADYLNSDMWAGIKRRAYKRKGESCSLCKSLATEMHHNRYAVDDLIGSTLEHLHPLCSTCHESIEHDQAGHKVDLLTARRVFNERRQLFIERLNGTKKLLSSKERRRKRKADKYTILPWLK